MTAAHDPPRLTLIIPALNSGAHLESALCSALDQGYPNLELIVTDGGSTDGSDEIVRLYQSQLTLWRRGADAGPSAAIAAALERASGELVGVLRAQDVLLPEALRSVADRLTGADAAPWLVGQGLRIGPRDETLGPLTASAPQRLLGHLGEQAGAAPAATSFYRRDAIDAVGGFDATLHRAYGYDLHARLLAADFAPALLGRPITAVREPGAPADLAEVLTLGREYLAVIERRLADLPELDRIGLRRGCDERRRVYAQAEAEAGAHPLRAELWAQLLRRPQWLADPAYRQSLLADVYRPNQAA